MTLRDAIREMVRWCKATGKYCGCLSGGDASFRDGLLMAAHETVVAELLGESVPEKQLLAARSVWATL